MPRKPKVNLTLSDMLLSMGEELNRTAHTPNINAYEPHEKQRSFHTSHKKMRLYIGGNRSGKTTGGIVEDIWWLTRRHPYRRIPDRPIAGRIICVDFLNGIEKIIKPQLKQWIPPSELRGGSWSSAWEAYTRTLYFENGSFVELMSYDQDLDKFAGTSRDFIHFDEEPPEIIYTENLARLIDRKGSAWITMTPVEGMTWIYDTVYEPGKFGDPGIDIIEVDMTENPHLDQEEVESFLNSLSEDEREARGSGKFVQIGGLVYKTFSPKIHVIDPIDPAELKGPEFKHYMSLDHGFNNPTAVLWHVADRENQVITFDEHYESGRIIDYHAQVIHERNKLHGRVPDLSICDPALQQKQAVTGTSIQTEYAVRGIGMVVGNNDVVTGVAKVAQYLNTFGPTGRPCWQITSNCQNLIREIMRLSWQTWSSRKQQNANNAYEKIHKKDDHACDSCRYFFSFMPELKQSTPRPVSVQKPNFGANTAINPVSYRIDPNVTPEGLAKAAKTKKDGIWRIDLNDE